MRTVLVIFKKELTDTLRDRRTLVSMILIPLLIFPLLIGISSRVMISQIREAQEKVLNIALITHGNAEEFRQMLLKESRIRLLDGILLDEARSLIQKDSLDACLEFAEDFDKTIAALGPGTITLYYKTAEKRDIEKTRVIELLNKFEDALRSARFRALNIDESVTKTVHLREENLASEKEKLAEVFGGALSYLFIIFCFLGSMYPAIDLAAGEKERGTLETILTSPASRLEILAGKFGVVVLTGILSVVIALIGLYIGVVQVREIPSALLGTILGILELRYILLLVSLLIPLSVFFAAILISLSIFAKSYKEAQSIITPMMIVIIVPAFIGLMPGITLNTITALIPILNVSLTTKAIIADTFTPILLAEVYLSLIAVASVSLVFCAWIFEREGTIFRGS
ncbi:MAG: ABC transporter permease [Bacteroidota bacterium]